MKLLLLSLFILSSSAFAGGGEGSQGGGAGLIIEQMIERTRSKGFFIEIPKLVLQGKKVKVIDTCVEQNRVRTYRFTDNYPHFVDIYSVPQQLEAKLSDLKLKSEYNLSLYQQIDLDHAGMRLKTKSRIKKVNYSVPECQ